MTAEKIPGIETEIKHAPGLIRTMTIQTSSREYWQNIFGVRKSIGCLTKALN